MEWDTVVLVSVCVSVSVRVRVCLRLCVMSGEWIGWNEQVVYLRISVVAGQLTTVQYSGEVLVSLSYILYIILSRHIAGTCCNSFVCQ